MISDRGRVSGDVKSVGAKRLKEKRLESDRKNKRRNNELP